MLRTFVFTLTLASYSAFSSLALAQTSKVASPPVVVVLTNSILPHDLTRSLDLGAAAYHVKTAERSEQPELIRALEKLLDDRVGRLKSTPA